MNVDVLHIEPWEREFICTDEYRRFEELVQACHHYRYIGLCYGESGVGKTWAARHYAHWESLVRHARQAYVKSQQTITPPVFNACRAVYYAVPVTNTPRIIREDLAFAFDTYRDAYTQINQVDAISNRSSFTLPVLIVDEAERLTLPALDELRDLYDRLQFGLLLIGSSTIQKSFRNHRQFFARIGFVHEYASLSDSDIVSLLTQAGTLFGYPLTNESFADPAALSILVTMTKGNFRLLKRMVEQIHRVMNRNDVAKINQTVIQTAGYHCLLE